MKSLTALLFALAIVSATPTAQAQQILKLGHVLPSDSQFGAAARVFGEEIAKRTNNKFRIDENPGSKLGSGKAMLAALKLGTIELLISSSGGALEEFNPAVGILDLMLLFRNREHAYSVLDGPIGQDLLDSFKAQGVVGLAWAENGFRQLTNSKQPVKAPGDLKGMKIRLSESNIYKRAFETLGASPGLLPFAQVYSALQSGQYDGEENPVTTIANAKLYEVQKYITLSDHTYAPAAILINDDVFKDLSPDEQTIFLEAAHLAAKASRDYVKQHDEAGLTKLKEGGMVVSTDFDRAAFEKALDPFYQEYAKRFTMEKIMAIKNTK